MYNEYFGFSEDPFNLTPDPDFLFMAVSHREGLSSMMSGIEKRLGLIIITGDVGTGKTTLIYTLLRDLKGKLKTVFIFNPRLTFKQLVKVILGELKVPVAGENTYTLLQKFKLFLRERLTEDETVAIIIDEAQQLSDKVLNDLSWFLEQDYPALKLLQILLVGQPELESKLNSEELRLLKKKITIQRRILPLNREESKNYIDHRLQVVGSSSSKIFTPEAIDLIFKFAKGIPRVINRICDGALFLGYDASAPKIDAKIVKETIARDQIACEEEPIPEEEVVAEKEDTPRQETIAREEVSEEKEVAVEEAVDHEEEFHAEIEAIGRTDDFSREQEGGLQRARSLCKKIGIGTLALVRTTVFSPLHFHWHKGRRTPPGEGEQTAPLNEMGQNLSPQQGSTKEQEENPSKSE